MPTYRFALAAVAALWLTAGIARAQVSVRVLATDPPGDEVTLARNQNFYLHLGYRSDHPIKGAVAGAWPRRCRRG